MNILRRILAAAIPMLVPVMWFAGAHSTVRSAKAYRVYVGNYTHKTDSKGIYQFSFDAATGKMSALSLAGETKDPSWVVVDPGGKYLYAANEHGKDSTVSAFAIDSKTAKLTLLNSRPALGEDPCHLSFDNAGKFLFVANYTSGNVVVYPILPDGKLGEPTANITDQGSTGPDKNRQDGPHAHWVELKENNRLYVADLGLDLVFVYQFDPKKGGISPIDLPRSIPPDAPIHDPMALLLSPGTGPRHAVFSPDQHFWYVLGELNSTVTAFAGFSRFQSIPTLPAGFSGRNDAAEIEIHPSGKFLYASNRGHDSIVSYTIDSQTGMLTLLQDVPTGGKEPRHFAIDPTGKFLLAENQNTNDIVEFKIDQSTGKLTPTGEVLKVPSPICLAFVPID